VELADWDLETAIQLWRGQCSIARCTGANVRIASQQSASPTPVRRPGHPDDPNDIEWDVIALLSSVRSAIPNSDWNDPENEDIQDENSNLNTLRSCLASGGKCCLSNAFQHWSDEIVLAGNVYHDQPKTSFKKRRNMSMLVLGIWLHEEQGMSCVSTSPVQRGQPRATTPLAMMIGKSGVTQLWSLEKNRAPVSSLHEPWPVTVVCPYLVSSVS